MSERKLLFLRFLAGAVPGVFIHYIILSLLFFGAESTFLWATIVAYFCNYSAKFFIHKYWAFEDRRTSNILVQFLAYLLMGAINTSLHYFLMECVGCTFLQTQMIMVVPSLAVMYLISRHFIFSIKPAQA